VQIQTAPVIAPGESPAPTPSENDGSGGPELIASPPGDAGAPQP
jgi:hypothetical protein